MTGREMRVVERHRDRTVPGQHRHQCCERRNDRRIPSRPIHHRTIIRRPPEPYRAVGPLNWKAIHRNQVGDDLPPLGGP
jgi:hypothetical protein